MSDDEGHFELGALEAGTVVHLAAWKMDYGTLALRGIEIPADGVSVELSLTHATELSIETRFRQRAGQRYVLAVGHREERPWRAVYSESVNVKASGRSELRGLPAGRFRIGVFLVSKGVSETWTFMGEERVTLSAGERREISLDLDEMAARFGSASGRQVGPAAGSFVVEILSMKDPEERCSAGPVRCGEAGDFHFYGLPAGDWTVVARRPELPDKSPVRTSVQLGERDRQSSRIDVE